MLGDTTYPLSSCQRGHGDNEQSVFWRTARNLVQILAASVDPDNEAVWIHFRDMLRETTITCANINMDGIVTR